MFCFVFSKDICLLEKVSLVYKLLFSSVFKNHQNLSLSNLYLEEFLLVFKEFCLVLINPKRKLLLTQKQS